MLIQNASNLALAAAPSGSSSSASLVGIAAQQTPVDPPKISEKSAAAQTQPSTTQLESGVNKINKALQQANKSLELSFSVDKATNRQVIKMVDKDTGDTIMQIPSEAVLAISQGIDEFQQGLLLRQKA